MRNRIGLTLVVVASIAGPRIPGSQSKSTERHSVRQPQIVFVCEHGAALSVVSAAYFNKLAREQRLNLHAVARGTTPQKDIAVSARDGLQAESVASEMKRPQALSQEDAAHALRIVAFCPLPAKYSRMAPVETWDDVPSTSANYGLARDAILKHLKELIRELKRDETKP